MKWPKRNENMTGTFAHVHGACGAKPAAQKAVNRNIWNEHANCRHSSTIRMPGCCQTRWWQHPHPEANEEPIEEAELLENLGEFPGRTDQGDRVPAPMTKRKARAYLRRG